MGCWLVRAGQAHCRRGAALGALASRGTVELGSLGRGRWAVVAGVTGQILLGSSEGVADCPCVTGEAGGGCHVASTGRVGTNGASSRPADTRNAVMSRRALVPLHSVYRPGSRCSAETIVASRTVGSRGAGARGFTGLARGTRDSRGAASGANLAGGTGCSARGARSSARTVDSNRALEDRNSLSRLVLDAIGAWRAGSALVRCHGGRLGGVGPSGAESRRRDPFGAVMVGSTFLLGCRGALVACWTAATRRGASPGLVSPSWARNSNRRSQNTVVPRRTQASDWPGRRRPRYTEIPLGAVASGRRKPSGAAISTGRAYPAGGRCSRQIIWVVGPDRAGQGPGAASWAVIPWPAPIPTLAFKRVVRWGGSARLSPAVITSLARGIWRGEALPSTRRTRGAGNRVHRTLGTVVAGEAPAAHTGTRGACQREDWLGAGGATGAVVSSGAGS